MLQKQNDEIVLMLACRKIKPLGSRLVRRCWCNISADTCPVHVLWAYSEQLPTGHQPFANLNMKAILLGMRRRLELIGFTDALSYRTHDFRRGHARDLQASGASLLEILQVGE